MDYQLFNIFYIILAFFLVFVAPGYCLISYLRPKERPGFADLFFITVLVSVTVSGFIGLALAQAGVYSLFNMLLSIVLLLAFFVALSPERLKRGFLLPRTGKIRLTHIFIVLILITSATLFSKPFEWILGGRDPGVYVNAGVMIARTGSLVFHDRFLAEMDDSLFHELYPVDDQFPVHPYKGTPIYQQFPGFYITDKDTGELMPQFLHLWMIWIAIFYSILGLKLSLYVTPFFALLSVLSVYLFTKDLFDGKTALIASLLLSLNYAEIWYARYPTAEIFTQFLFFSGLYLFNLAVKHREKMFSLIAALALGQTFLARVDMILIVFPLAFYYLFFLFKHRKFSSVEKWFIFPFLLVLTYALLHWRIFAPFYTAYFFQGFEVLIAGVAVFSFILITFLVLYTDTPRRIMKRIGWNKEKLKVFSSLFLILICVYSYYLRPAGDITSDSYNFVKLGWYLPGIGLALAIIGLVLIINLREDSGVMLFVCMLLLFATFFIYASQISPDHPWWVRRFVPVVIPSLIIVSSFFLVWLSRIRYKIAYKNSFFLLSAMLLFLLVAGNVGMTRVLFDYVEYQGSIYTVNEFAGKIGDGAVVFIGGNRILNETFAVPLYYLYGKNINPVANFSEPGLVDRILSDYGKEKVALISDERITYPGLYESSSGVLVISKMVDVYDQPFSHKGYANSTYYIYRNQPTG